MVTVHGPPEREKNELQNAFSRLKRKTAAEEVQSALKASEPDPMAMEESPPETVKSKLHNYH